MNAELLDYFGNDLMVSNAARVSYGKEKEAFDLNDEKLLNYLVKHGHTSPFRHPQLQFRIKCPIFVERQLFKHQVGLSANSISGRYVDFSDEYFWTNKLRLQSEDSKQGSGGVLDDPALLVKMEQHIEASKRLYKELCEANVAKEQARIILPLALKTQFIWTGSFLAFVHMWKLRLKPDTQLETRQVARDMLDCLTNLPDSPFESSIKAFGLERL